MRAAIRAGDLLPSGQRSAGGSEDGHTGRTHKTHYTMPEQKNNPDKRPQGQPQARAGNDPQRNDDPARRGQDERGPRAERGQQQQPDRGRSNEPREQQR